VTDVAVRDKKEMAIEQRGDEGTLDVEFPVTSILACLCTVSHVSIVLYT
jgi:hypothetical protein